MSPFRDYFPPAAIFQESLAALGLGHPIWDCGWSTLHETQLGDVGYLHARSAFIPMFNVTLPADHPRNTLFGVPDDFEVLDLGQIKHVGGYISPGEVLAGPGIERVDKVKESMKDILTAGKDGEHHFTSTRDTGALLYLPDGASLVEVSPEAHRRISAYIAKHYKSWARYLWTHSSFDCFPRRRLEDLIFVSGMVQAPKHDMTTYEKKDGPWSRIPAADTWWFKLKTFFCEEFDDGDYYSPAIQRRTIYSPSSYGMTHEMLGSLFLVEYRCRSRRKVWGTPTRRIYQALTKDQSPDDSRSPGAVIKSYDACDEVLDYILRYSSAKVAITSSRNIRALLSTGQISMECWPHSVSKYLRKSRPTITVGEDGIGRIDMETTDEKADLASLVSSV